MATLKLGLQDSAWSSADSKPCDESVVYEKRNIGDSFWLVWRSGETNYNAEFLNSFCWASGDPDVKHVVRNLGLQVGL